MSTTTMRPLLRRLYSEGWIRFQGTWMGWLNAKKPALHVVFTPNPEHIVQAARLPAFAAALREADVVIPDGHGLVWAVRWWRFLAPIHRWRPPVPLASVIPGVQVVEWWLREAPRLKFRVLLLGAIGDTAAAVAHQFDPSGKWIRGTTGYVNVRYATAEEEQGVRMLIADWKPHVIFVAFGAPRQELWVTEHRRFLRAAGVRVAMVVGGALTTLSGRVPRPPEWVQRVGLEWLYRLWQEPWRWRRQRRLLVFVWWALTKRAWWCKPTR